VLPDGPMIRISQSLGPGSKGCRLDPAALEQAVALVSAGLETKPHLMVVNKFGKHEADGRGFRPVIGDAMMRGIPILTGVNRLNHDAFLAFSQGMAERLPAEPEALDQWFSQIDQGLSVNA
jgi:hypothetical protein